jgi:hypothetical protein
MEMGGEWDETILKLNKAPGLHFFDIAYDL